MENLTPEYEAARLKAARKIESDIFDGEYRPMAAAACEKGEFDDSEQVTRHFPAFDACHAHAQIEIAELRAEIAALKRDIEAMQYDAKEDRS